MRLSTLCAALLVVLLSACSTPEQPTTPVPSADDAILFVPIDDSSVEVRWTDPAFDGGTVILENGSGSELRRIEAKGMGAVLAGLDIEESYVVVVRQRTSGGIGRMIRGRLAQRGSVANASALEATSLSSTSVGLRWTASTTPGATYRVVYGLVDASGVSIGTRETLSGVTGSSAVITGLTQVPTGGSYRFTLHTVSGSSISTGTTINWAPATRMTRDAAAPDVTLRMYEFASQSGPGLILDPALGGPRNASLHVGSPNPGAVALAIYNDRTSSPAYANEFDIGPAYALVGFKNADNYDSSSYISKVGFDVASLDDLYVSKGLDTYFNDGGVSAGNISAFTLPNSKPDGKGVAFFMHIGNGINRHYLRVLVKNVGGKLLQGTGTNRFVEVEISYQNAANVPYAKGVVRSETPATFHAYRQFIGER